ncbi:hypothetical protein CAPTEDRAFT_189533 [Capitella teleta]|uniref:DNA2/NAM7 helicase-like C-terminal domain-containing protein n=1 Tax=Capitella teleta TaxID=283909 RepID=R7V7Q7_CAPTE|nr:hypothetical protein CAPTEDRAFT_189533 [Capitella teleta]|eukprot:ELU14522.1 hypothetical protein CAPTEDRAFT_189533 [Capitella teleta]
MSFLERLIQRPLYDRDEVKFKGHGAYDPLLVTKLIENYRSHPVLLSLPSQIFYHSELKASSDPALVECFCGWSLLPSLHFPLIFHGVRGVDLRVAGCALPAGRHEHTQHLMSWDDVGVITPYRKQVEKIRVRFNEQLVDGDVRHNLGFLSNPKRFNVSVTRAMSLLIIIANPHVLAQVCVCAE